MGHDDIAETGRKRQSYIWHYNLFILSNKCNSDRRFDNVRQTYLHFVDLCNNSRTCVSGVKLEIRTKIMV